MRFWDASVIIPLVVTESTTPELQALAAEDRVMLVWWATTYKVYCCGAENDSFWLDPCAWECVGDSKPSGGELARVFGASPGALSSVSGGSKISQLRVPIWFAPVQRSSPGKAEQ